MSDVIKLPLLDGNGARKAMQRYFDDDTWPRYVTEAGFQGPQLCAGDHLLAWLWAEGFRVVRQEEKP